MMDPRARACMIADSMLRDDSNYISVHNKNNWRKSKCEPTQEDESCEESLLISYVKDNFSKRITSEYVALMSFRATPLDRIKHVRHGPQFKKTIFGYVSAEDIYQQARIGSGKINSNNEITKFIASDRLVSYYIKAVKGLSEISKNLREQESSDKITIAAYEQKTELDKITKKDAAIHVQKLVTRLISTIGKGAFDANLDCFHLTNNVGKFTPNVCKVILDRILIDEYDIPDFLNQLYIDLLPIAKNKTFCRKWGKLVIQNNQLSLELNKHKEENESSWNRAKMF